MCFLRSWITFASAGICWRLDIAFAGSRNLRLYTLFLGSSFSKLVWQIWTPSYLFFKHSTIFVALPLALLYRESKDGRKAVIAAHVKYLKCSSYTSNESWLHKCSHKYLKYLKYFQGCTNAPVNISNAPTKISNISDLSWLQKCSTKYIKNIL